MHTQAEELDTYRYVQLCSRALLTGAIIDLWPLRDIELMCGLRTGAFAGLGGFGEDAKKQLDFTLDLKDAAASPPETPDAKQARFLASLSQMDLAGFTSLS